MLKWFRTEKENKFNDWRRRNRITIQKFCDETRIKYSTVLKWTLKNHPADPHSANKDIVRKVYPDCPLVS